MLNLFTTYKEVAKPTLSELREKKKKKSPKRKQKIKPTSGVELARQSNRTNLLIMNELNF